MKKYITILMFGLLFLAGCQQEQKGEQIDTPEQREAKKAAMSEEQSISYAIGVSLASNIKSVMDNFPSLKIDQAIAQQGFSDYFKQQGALLTEEEVKQKMAVFQQQLGQAQADKITKDNEAKLAANKAFLEENLSKGFSQTESGLQYKVIEEGKGKLPSETDTVKVHYTGTLTDGSKFDSSVDRGQPFEFSLSGGVIEGWLEGVRMMKVGSKYRFAIPPDLAYGTQARGQAIPANSILLFDVELLEIVDTAEKPQEDKAAK